MDYFKNTRFHRPSIPIEQQFVYNGNITSNNKEYVTESTGFQTGLSTMPDSGKLLSKSNPSLLIVLGGGLIIAVNC